MERPVIVQNMVRILSEHQILSMTLLNILKSKYVIPFKKATSLKSVPGAAFRLLMLVKTLFPPNKFVPI